MLLKTQGQAEVLPASAHRTGAGASVYKELAYAAFLQALCRTTYGGRILSNVLFIHLFLYIYIYIYKHKSVQFSSKVTIKIPQQYINYLFL